MTNCRIAVQATVYRRVSTLDQTTANQALWGDAVPAHWTASDVHLLIGGAGRSDRPYASGQN